jgi:glycine oxidase
MAGRDEKFDVVIVGGGIIGCAAAYYLAARGGVRVALLERESEVGAESTKAAAGILNPFYAASEPSPYFDFCVEAHALYHTLVPELRDLTGIDPQFLKWGVLGLLLDDDDEKAATEKIRWQRERGLSVERLTPEEALRREPAVTPEIRGALYFPQDFHIDNGLLVEALAEAARRRGAEVRLGAAVTGLLREGKRVTGVETETGRIAAGSVVLAAGAWSAPLARLIGREIKVEPARGQIVVMGARETFTRTVVYAKEQYVVPRLGGEVIVGSTLEFEGFDKRATAEGIRHVLERGIEMVPGLRDLTFKSVTAGLRPYSADTHPILGSFEDVPGLIVATGHSRKGILLGPFSGKIVADLVLDGKTAVPIGSYAPERFAPSP